MTDLDKLIEAVEGGWWYGDTTSMLGADGHMDAYRAFSGSLDAAKALHEALLPGWKVLWDSDCNGSLVIVSQYTCYGAPDEVVKGSNTCPARAWLIAVLKAYRALQETNQ